MFWQVLMTCTNFNVSYLLCTVSFYLLITGFTRSSESSKHHSSLTFIFEFSSCVSKVLNKIKMSDLCFACFACW